MIITTLMVTLMITHCVKSFQIRSYFWSLFFYIRAEYGDLQSGHFSRSYFDDKSGLSLRTLSLFYGSKNTANLKNIKTR